MANETTEKKKVSGIDINKLLKKASEAYDKKDAGLIKQLSTGSSVIVPTEDKDFILWTKGNYWQQLTSLKGLPFGYICQISGRPDSGKSTTAAAFMKFAQDQDVLVILWDSEKKFSAQRFDEQIGGNSDNLLIVRTSKILDGCKAVAHLVSAAKDQNPDVKILIVWDSVGASMNQTEDNEDNEDYSMQPGVSAKENSFAIKKFNKLANKYMNHKTGEQTIATLVINQVYANLGSVGYTEKGGSEIYYLSSLIVQMNRKGDLTRTKDGEKYKYGIVSRAKVRKNHLFDGKESIAEMDIVVSADGIHLAKDVKSFKDIDGWDDVKNKSEKDDDE